jgi:hypothetical protein
LPIVDIFCDESCHLQRDSHTSMSLGAVSVPHDSVQSVSAAVRALKQKHGLNSNFELKWSKVSPAKLNFYLAVVDYFFDEPTLSFRGLVATHKERLDHTAFGQDHDTWYHKMYYELLHIVLDRTHRFRIYLDIKDTRGGPRSRTLHDVLAHSILDFDRRIVERVQIQRSHELQPLQLTDFLLGAISSASRRSINSAAKSEIIRAIEERSGSKLTRTTPLGDRKFNLFHWTPRNVA